VTRGDCVLVSALGERTRNWLLERAKKRLLRFWLKLRAAGFIPALDRRGDELRGLPVTGKGTATVCHCFWEAVARSLPMGR